jgi:hypothetical protein
MFYSAQIERELRTYTRVVGRDAALNPEDFIKKYWWRQHGLPSMKIPKAVDAWFTADENGDQAKLAAMIEVFNDCEIVKLEQEVFKQKKRLADAERALKIKETKTALNDQRVSSHKIDWALGKLVGINRTELKPVSRRAARCVRLIAVEPRSSRVGGNGTPKFR